MLESFCCDVSHAVQDLSEDGSELSLVRIGWGSYDPLEGDGHMFQDNVETIVGGEGLEGGNNVPVLNLSEHVERLLGDWL